LGAAPMASYQGHLTFASALAAGYGCVAAGHLDLDWGPLLLGAGLTSLGGLLPDLDSDSGIPVRKLFGIAAVAGPFLLWQRLENFGFVLLQEKLVVLCGLYLLIRYGLSALFKRITVHRGMFHSVPAMLITGLLVFLVYQSSSVLIRVYLAGGMMLGFFSHLLLDELYRIDLKGASLHLKKHAGSALKFVSPSWSAMLTTYGLLTFLFYLAYLEVQAADSSWRMVQDQVSRVYSTLAHRPN
jgi:hypothetical protein